MLISNARKDTDGEWQFDLNLEQNEVDYLVNFSVQMLLAQGALTLTEQDEEQEVELPDQNAPSSNSVN